MRTVLHAGVGISERLLRLRVDDAPRRLLLQRAASRGLPSRKGDRRLLKERIVEHVMRVRIFRELYVLPSLAQPLDIGPAWGDQDIIVGCTVEQADGLVAYCLVVKIASVARRVEGHRSEEHTSELQSLRH